MSQMRRDDGWRAKYVIISAILLLVLVFGSMIAVTKNSVSFQAQAVAKSSDKNPEVQFVYPAAGATLGESLVVAKATDDKSIEHVTFMVDRIPVPTSFSAYPFYGATVNINSLAYGRHLLTVIATDGSGQSTSSSIVVYK
jgi:hypothetical protein